MESFERTNRQPSIAQTVLASFSIMCIYVILLFAVPILMGLYDLLVGPWSAVWNPAVSHSREDPPSTLTVLVRLAITSGGAAFGSFFITARVFSRAHGRTVTVVFSLAFLCLLTIYALGAFLEPAYTPTVEVLIWLAKAVPPFSVVLKAWNHVFFEL